MPRYGRGARRPSLEGIGPFRIRYGRSPIAVNVREAHRRRANRGGPARMQAVRFKSTAARANTSVKVREGS